jgi:NAD-dependent dihydropyrimidine dehydrogenase PreA subunit
VSAGELHGIFIRVEVDESARADAELARKLEEVCPVDIYAVGADGGVAIVDENLDECVLCELCLDAAPPGAVGVVKRYDGDAALTRPARRP